MVIATATDTDIQKRQKRNYGGKKFLRDKKEGKVEKKERSFIFQRW